MEMKKLSVDELKAGMVFDKAVYIDMNNILLAPMVPLKEEDIQRLIKWGIEEIETAGEVIKRVEPEKKLSIKDEVTRLTKLAESGKGIEGGEGSMTDVCSRILRLTEDVFDKVRNAAGYEKEKILDAVGVVIDAVRKDKNGALDGLTKEREGRYLHTLGASVAVLSAVIGIDIGYGKHRLCLLYTSPSPRDRS